jgi:hypothetical protein
MLQADPTNKTLETLYLDMERKCAGLKLRIDEYVGSETHMQAVRTWNEV